MNTIIIAQHEYQNSDEVVFQTITDNIYIPHKFVLFLKDTVFNNTIIYFRDYFYQELEGENICILLLKETINNRWEFGISFIEQHSILFNYNDSSITFYGNETKLKPYHESHRDIHLIRKVMRILNIINIFTMTLLFYSKLTTNNK